MGITTGSGPFGSRPSGTTTISGDRFVLVDPFARRVRAVKEGRTVVDSDKVELVHVSGSLPRYSFPKGDVQVESEEDPEAPGRVTVSWDAVDAWYEEDERVLVHPRDPYHRIDTFLTSRRVRVCFDSVELATSTRACALYETGLSPRWYLPRADVATALLEASPTVSQCPYKGTARYWSLRLDGRLVEDVAWSYEDEVRREGEPVRWLVAFDDTKVEVLVDGVSQGQ